jgi:hypothetical protein
LSGSDIVVLSTVILAELGALLNYTTIGLLVVFHIDSVSDEFIFVNMTFEYVA